MRTTIIYILFLFLLLEITFRVAFSINYKTSFIKPQNLLYQYYPALKQSFQKNENYNILLLGASVLEDVRGNIRQKLKDYLKEKLPYIQVEILNFSQPGQTSKDSWNKIKSYKELERADLVIFYHGINEAKANSCPDSIFSLEYNHYQRIKRINKIMNHSEANFSVIPLYLDMLWESMNPKMSLEKYYSTPGLGDKWLVYGDNIKTEITFENNLSAIFNACKKHQISLLCPEYVYNLPKNYNRDSIHLFYTKTKFGMPRVELWGIPKNVKKGIETHNRVNEKVAKKYNFPFVKTNHLLPKTKENFNDICHLTDVGAIKFIDIIGPKVVELINEQ